MHGLEMVARMKIRRAASGSVGAIMFLSEEADALLNYIESLEKEAAADQGKTPTEDKKIDTDTHTPSH